MADRANLIRPEEVDSGPATFSLANKSVYFAASGRKHRIFLERSSVL